MISVHLDSVEERGPRDPSGASSYVIGRESSKVFEGDAPGAVAYLKGVPVGTSVCVRHAGGLRSCMNKPALWDWVADLT